MTTRLNPEQRAHWDRAGYLAPLEALSREEVSEHLAVLEHHETSRAGRLPPVLNAKAHLVLPNLWRVVHDRRLVDVVADLLGPDLLCWGASFFAKGAEDPAIVTWHQDVTYWGLDKPDAVTVWLAFTASGPDNGGLQVIPGSHREQHRHRDARQPHNMLPLDEEVDLDLTDRTVVDVVLNPGQMSIHHARLIHGSPANRSGTKRIGFAIRYIASSVRQREGPGSATLVRGPDPGTFMLEQAPRAAFDPAALRHQRASLKHFAAAVAAAKRHGPVPAPPIA